MYRFVVRPRAVCRCLLAAVLVLLLGSGPMLAATTIFVDVSNLSGTEDGSANFPYTTINAALAVALADDVVQVSLNPAFLKDALTAGFNQIRIGEDTAPIKFCSDDGDFSILMPLRNVDAKPVRDYLQKLPACSAPPVESPAPIPTPVPVPQPISQPQTEKETVMSDPQEENASESEGQDPLEQLLNALAD